MIIPLGIGAYKRTAAFAPEVVCLNFLLEPDKSGISPDKIVRVQRPGLLSVGKRGVGPVQAIDNRPRTSAQLVVSGGRLFDAGEDKGSVGGGRIVPLAGTLFHHAILGDRLYLYDGTLTPVTMPDDAPPIVDIEQLNGYILILTETGRFYWIMPGETTVDALAFANAESSADRGVAIRRIGDEFWIFGTRTIEPWQATGDDLAPFQRALGRLYERGAKARDTVRRFDNSLMWVGDDNEVYRGGEVPQVVSDPGLAERIRRASGKPMSAWTFGLDGHEFYALNIGSEGTFVFDALVNAWAEFSSGSTAGWLAYVGNQEGGDVSAGDEGGNLYRVTPDAATDNGVAFPRILTATVPLMGKPPRNDSVSIGVGSDTNVTVRFRWKDGQDDYPAGYYDEMLARAPLDVATIYRLGQPDQPYRTFEVSVVEPVAVRIAGMFANEGWK